MSSPGTPGLLWRGTAPRESLAALGVDPHRIYVDHGLTGTNRARPGLREVMAACRTGDTLVVAKLDRLARSAPDARDIVDELTARGVRLNPGGSIHDPTDPIGRLLCTVLSMIAEFEADLARARTREGMAVAQDKGPAARQAAQAQPEAGGPPGRVVARWQHTTFELVELFNVARSTVHRAIQRCSPPADPVVAAADPAR